MVCALFVFKGLTAQEKLGDQVVFSIEDDKVTAEEFMAVFNKNRNLGEDIDPKTPEEYLELYIKFKLKVHEAKAMGMDTLPSFKREYNNYRNQLAKPYLSDRNMNKELMSEAYTRMKWDVRASHILLAAGPESDPLDTIKALRKIETLKDRISKGENFEQLAKEYSMDQYSAPNGGDLGYFTVFNMLYPFESAAYKTEVGNVSGIVRTKFGYHLVKTTAKRPARGMVEVAHIMVIDNEETKHEERLNASQKIQEIYKMLQSGESFERLVEQYSEDKVSARNGGKIQPFGINKMYTSFEEAAFGLENPGDVSEPIKTPVGWHIIKLVRKEGIPEYDDIKTELKTKVERDTRSQQSKVSIVKRLKKEYGYQENRDNISKAFAQVGSEYLQMNYVPQNIENGGLEVLKFTDNSYTIEDFLNFLSKNQHKERKIYKLKKELNNAFKKFVEAKLIAYEKTRLESKYPEFRLLSREYFEGILLFDLTEEKIWKKSVSDSTGLATYFADHQDQYMWDTRYEGYLVDAIDKKTAKKAGKALKGGQTPDELNAEFNTDSQLNVKIEEGVWEPKDSEAIQKLDPEEGANGVKKVNGRYFTIFVKKVMPAQAKTLEESRGAAISDYQTYLEEQWIAELRKKYSVNIDNSVLEKVVEELKNS